MAYFRNLTARVATACCFVGVGRWRDYSVEPGGVVEVAETDVNVFATQPTIFERCEAPVATPEPALEPEPTPDPTPAEQPKPVAVPPVRRRR